MRKYCILVLLLFAAAFIVGSPAYSILVTIGANDDCFVWSNATEAVLPHDSSGIYIKGQTGAYTRRGYVEFTFQMTDVTSAVLYLYNTGNGGASWKCDLKGKPLDIDENTLTWNTKPDFTTSTTLGQWSLIANAGSQGWFSMDITAFYNANKGETVTIQLTSPTTSTTGGGTFEDHEGNKLTTNYPRLEILPVPEPSSLLALACGCVGIMGLVRRRRS